MNASRRITLLGSTGSIGQNTLAVIDKNPQYKLHALSANKNFRLLFEQCQQYQPTFAVLADAAAAAEFAALISNSECETQLLTGPDAQNRISSDEQVDTVMAAIVGAAGLESTLSAVNAGKRVLLANKESLVMTGELLTSTAAASGASIIPIDSEHNAIFQCLPSVADGLSNSQLTHVEKIVLTASGGPFLTRPLDQFQGITPQQACQHPKWAMGKKISVDSATMMNKGLEVIEACYLFNLKPQQVEVLIHPQSIIHSMVHYCDGSVLAQMANPDMRIPIAYGLAYPDRIESGAKALNLADEKCLEFSEPDLARFPCLGLGIEAAKSGGTAPALLNAANEVAVAAFLEKRISFLQIPLIIEAVLSKIPCEAASSLAIIRDIDRRGRSLANDLILKDFK